METIKDYIGKMALFKIAIYLYHNQGRRLNITTISKRCDITFAHTVKMIGMMHANGFVDRVRRGREVVVFLTDDGKEFVECVANMFRILNINSEMA